MTTVDRLAMLQRLTADLSTSLDADAIADVVVTHGIDVLGARLAQLWIVPSGSSGLRLARSKRPSSPRLANAENDDVPSADLREALARGSPVYVETSRGGVSASLPLLADGRAVGAVVLDIGRPFHEAERMYIEVFSSHIAYALERARLFAAERAGRDRIELLYTLVEAAARARTLDEIFAPALDAVSSALSTSRAGIMLFDDQGVIRYRAARGISQSYQEASSFVSPWRVGTRDVQSRFVGDVRAEPNLAPHLESFVSEGIEALAFVPLVHDGALIGKLVAFSDQPRQYTVDDMRLAHAIASQLAQAIVRKVAEDESLRARTVAEDFAQRRSELLNVVAHDLRNPLAAAQLKVQLMRVQARATGSITVTPKDLDVVERNMRHMGRLIGDLLDAASIEGGRIAVVCARTCINDCIAEALELTRTLAEARSITMTIGGAPELYVSCDRQRTLQILSNLLGNAVKYTPSGGAIRVEAHEGGADEVRISVADTGPGIPEEEREHVFDRYVRGRTSGAAGGAGGAANGHPSGAPGASARSPSLGLGLFIAKGLAVAQGGRIWIERNVPHGTRVVFTLLRA